MKGFTMTDDVEQIFGGSPLMAILRNQAVERSIALSTTAWDLGIDSVEITLQSDQDLEGLRTVGAALAAG